MQALDLLVSAPRLYLLRTLAIGSEAAEEAGLRRSNNTFVSSVAKGVFWTHEAGTEVGPGSDPTVVGVAGDSGVRALRGELFIPKGTKQSFAFPRFACRVSFVIVPISASRLVFSSLSSWAHKNSTPSFFCRHRCQALLAPPLGPKNRSSRSVLR